MTLSYNTAIPSLKDFDMSHPLDTSVTFRRLVPQGSSLFRSAQVPMLVTCTNGIISVAPKSRAFEDNATVVETCFVQQYVVFERNIDLASLTFIPQENHSTFNARL